MAHKLSVLGGVAQLPFAAILLTTDLVTSLLSWTSTSIVGFLEWILCAKVTRPDFHEVRYKCAVVRSKDYAGEIDVDRTLAASTFPIGPDRLVELCKEVCKHDFGCTSPSLLAEDFQFVAPIVGPLPKDEFVKAFSGFDVKTAFPNQEENFWGFSVDPQEPNRVWFFSRARSVHTGPLKFGPKTIQATNKVVNHPPQALSMLFDERGQCYTLTVGYVMDKRIGNTGGMGGLFGPLFAVGHPLPFPEGKPWKPSIRLQALERLQAMGVAFGMVK